MEEEEKVVVVVAAAAAVVRTALGKQHTLGRVGRVENASGTGLDASRRVSPRRALGGRGRNSRAMNYPAQHCTTLAPPPPIRPSGSSPAI